MAVVAASVEGGSVVPSIDGTNVNAGVNQATGVAEYSSVSTSGGGQASTGSVGNMAVLPYETLVTCFIRNMLTGDVITFVTQPDDITESFEASFEPQEVRGRSAPYFGYAGSGARSVSYSIMLNEDLLGAKFMETVHKMRALVYPKYQGSLVIPPTIKMQLGDMVRQYDGACFIVNSVGVSWNGTILEGSNHYSCAEISLDLTEVVTGALPVATTSMDWW